MTKSPTRCDASTRELLNWLWDWQRGWARRSIRDDHAEPVLAGWFGKARIAQYPLGLKAPTWLVIGGRGAGKTRLGSQWVNGLVGATPPFSDTKHFRIALVGETLGDVREVMVEGPSGIVAVSGAERPRYEASRRRLLWESGAVAQAFSSEDPESLRGPQFEAAWCDELAKWRNPDATWDMLQFGLRLGARPRQLVTTTARPIPLLKRLLNDRDVDVTRMRTTENAANLAPGFLAQVEERYGGTRLGRQELDGDLIEDREDALWSRAAIEAATLAHPPELGRIVVAVDPPASSRRTSDACGIVAAGLDGQGRAVVIADATVRGVRPMQWAGCAVGLFHRLGADCVVAEVNQGGDMVAEIIRAVDPGVPVRAVRARRGKWLRAEPVAMLYQQGRVLHAGRFAALEDEMCDFGTDGLSGGRSPDRVDALVWAVSELIPGGAGEPKIRAVGQ
ncbi:MAG: DNA-packaging protein [Rhizobiaceae bacterium]|nr:DNA-packaging protein [Rhizobiaceae bacterium]